MLKDRQLITAVGNIATKLAQGTTFRFIHIKYQESSLSSIGSYKSGGRYNIAQRFAALYTSDSPVTALQELNVLLGQDLFPVKSPPYLLLSIEYALESVLDLTDLENQTILQTNIQELTGAWLPIQLNGEIAPTQFLGLAAYETQNIQALKVPSRFSSALNLIPYNLVIFPDRLSSGSFLRVYDDSKIIQAQLP